MARDLKAQLELTADASGVEAGVGKAKKSLASLGAAAKTEGDKAAAGLEGIGAGGDAAAKKVDRSTRSLIGSIQRTTATLEAGGRTSAKYFETLASQRGVDVGVLKPYLDQLDAVRARQAEATLALAKGGAGLNQYGASAKQTAAALRGVPAQLTDIVTSLQGGQQPLTVLLQQGGQLRDMFGGVVPAARALGGAVVGLINPFTVAAGAVAALGLAYFQGSKEADEYARSLILTNNASGKTVGQLEQMAQRMSAVSGTQSAAAAAVATFASSTVLAGSNIERFSALALRMEKATVQAVGETKKQFEELARSPVAAATKLNETTNFLTDSLYRQIKALEEQGRTAEAAAVAMNAFAADGEAKMARLESRLGTIERAWASITSQAKRAWDAMLNVGRPDTLQDQLSAAQEQLDQRLAQGGPRRGSNRTQQQYDQANQALRDRIDTLKESVRLEGSVADRQRAQVASVQARIDFDKEADKYLSRRVQMEREIARFNQLADKAGASAVERERGLAAIRDKYKTPAGPKRSEDKSTLAFDLSSIKSQAEQLIGTYANSERILESIRAAGLLSDQEYYEAKRGFLRLESQAKESALQDEIARYQREQLTGKDKIDNERKIAEASAKLAMVRADASSRMVVLGNQEAAAQTKVALAYLSARQAAQDYLSAMELQQARGLSGMGRGAIQRDRDAGLNQIEDRYAGQRRDLENNRAQLELEGKFTQDARAQYEQRLAIINEFQSKATASFMGYYDRLQAANANWANGAGEALQNYIDQSRTVAQQTEQLFTKAFGNMEDALVSFVTTGKLDFSDLADSIVADITRMIIKQQLLAPLAASLQGGMSSGSGAGGFISSFLGNLFGGGRAIGGAVSAGRLYQVNERRPELLDVGGKQFLMMGNQNGRVDANRAPAAPGSTHNYNIHVSMPQGASRATAQQFGQQVARQLSMAQARNG